MTQKIEALVHLIETVHRLRAPGGCPWDQAQTHQSLRQYLIEEAYEVLDVLDKIHTQEDLKTAKIAGAFREELGDVLMQVLLHSEMVSETGVFDFYDVAKSLDEKLIRRHPHVFGEIKEDSAESAFQRWEKEKAKEKAANPDGINSSILDGVPRSLPSLQKGARILERVTKVGFQWKDMEGPLSKVEEEWGELKVEILELEKLTGERKSKKSGQSEQNQEKLEEIARKKVESELGDLLFTLCNAAYLLKVNPEDALRGTLVRFEERFRHVEKRIKEQGKTPEQSNLEEMDRYWDEAKNIAKSRETSQVWGLTGGIGAGKTTVGRIFAEFGIPVVDADQIAKDLTKKGGAAHEPILNRFGTAEPQKLRELVFRDPQAKTDLEGILHPLIQNESRLRIQELAIRHRIVLYEAALLVESGRHSEMTGLILVEAPREIRLNRLMTRPGLDLETAKAIISTQLPDAEQRRHAKVIIENVDDLNILKQKIKKIMMDRNWTNL